MTQALLIGLLAGVGILDERVLGTTLFGRPIVMSMLVGLVLGNVTQGIIIGAQLELIWMGIAGIGASTPPDYVTGGVIGTALALQSGKGIGIALAIAVPVAVLAQALGVLVRIINLYFSHKADKYAQQASFKGIAAMLWIPTGLFFLSTFIPAFLSMLIGADNIKAFINSVPQVILDGLTIAGNLLPAIGFALLLDMIFSKKLFVFFFLGFLAAEYFKINITGIALIAICLAIIITIYQHNGNTKHGATPDVQTNDGDNLTEGDIHIE